MEFLNFDLMRTENFTDYLRFGIMKEKLKL